MPEPQALAQVQALIRNIEQVIVGKREAIELALAALLCRGHLLIEDMPGLGKTMLARAVAGSLALGFRRVQFTPDLLPSDLTGVSIYNQKTSAFEFHPGPVFTNILLADEVNRATPRTQAALLESMEEGQVSADGSTYLLPAVFQVVATQNPIEMMGTYPLPEAQLDRFLMRIEMGYPALEDEVRIMGMQIKAHPIHTIKPVLAEAELLRLQEAARAVHVEESLRAYIVRLTSATRKHPDLVAGASPRGSLGLMRAAQALALIQGADYVEPTLVKRLVRPVLGHRLVLKPQARLRGVTEAAILAEAVNSVAVPV